MNLHPLRTTNYELQTSNRGFSLIEMMVVVGIFALLTGVIFSNYGQFKVNASLDNLAHQVALVVREAQVYGISVTQFQSQFKTGFGAYFSVDTPNTFYLFNDRASNGRYDITGNCSGSDPNDECVEKITISTGDQIEKIAAGEKTSGITNATPLKSVNIVFVRPNPEALIKGVSSDGLDISNNLPDVEIYMVSPRGSERKVIVWSTGQISVE